LSTTHRLAAEYGIAAYHQRRHDGFARNLVVRTSASTGAVMAILVTTTPTSDQEAAFIDAWMQQGAMLPPESSLLHAINDSWSPVAVGQIARTEGPGVLEETSHGITYRISPFSFFQTNTFQLPRLVGAAIDAAKLTADDVVWDLYCGTGTLTLPAARRSRHVIGAELVASSIADATANADRNGIANVEFHTVDLHSPKATPVLEAFQRPDVILIDPPRAGMHAMLVEHVLRIGAPRIVYVSCNPSTQARDCALMAEHYDVTDVTPVDMFPHTFHVESVAVLQRRS
jgi:23S rRNA (uracil1939-C5)-methyltransferase